MNLPNKLSIARALCIPVITVLLYMNDDGCRIAAGILFILAALTDLLDGKIARKYNLITDFGKFIDPVADKLLVLTTLVMLVRGGLMEAWVVVIILCRSPRQVEDHLPDGHHRRDPAVQRTLLCRVVHSGPDRRFRGPDPGFRCGLFRPE